MKRRSGVGAHEVRVSASARGLVVPIACAAAAAACAAVGDGDWAPATSTDDLTVIAGFEAESMTVVSGNVRSFNDPTASNKHAMRYWTNGRLSKTVTTSQSATTLRVRARAEPCGGAPELAVDVDGVRLAVTTVSAIVWSDVETSVTLAPGSHTIRLSFPNDAYVAGTCDRNLLVDRVTLGALAASPPPDAGADVGTVADATTSTGSGGDAAIGTDAGTDATTSSTTAPSGEAMPLGDLPGWHQVFTEDFTTTVPIGSFPAAVSTKWSAYRDGWKDTTGNGTYEPSKTVSFHDGTMDIYVHTENGVHFVAAPVPKIPGATGSGGGLLYGRYAIRFKAAAAHCYKTAWLLWPDSEVWPRDGEIDFPEGNLDGTISAFLHRQGGTSGGDQDAFPTAVTYTSWHTAIIEWAPTATNFLLDGKNIGTSTSRIPDTPMHWVIQTETSLSGCVPADATTSHVLVDWATVYTRVP